MKMFKKIACASLAMLAVTAVVSAKDFAKTQQYKAGQFNDVPEKQWYAADVKSAYELGFVNGKSDTLFVPEGNVTVAEGITMATRVHSIYNGKTIAEKKGGKWYDMYISYALENGMIKEGQFTNFDRNIMRYEMAMLFANSLPADYFAAKNDIKDIPDVAKTEDYYDELIMLYKAGVVLGSDDYGNFYATNPIKRSETAAIINRVALPENRVSGVLKEYGNREQAVFLIDDSSMTRTVRKKQMLASGWRYEDMGNPGKNTTDFTSNSFNDNSEEARVAIHRDVTVQTKGVVKVESVFNVDKQDGAQIIFADSDGTELFCLETVGGKYFAKGAEKQDTGVSLGDASKTKNLYFELDIDNGTAKVVIDGADAGIYTMNNNAKNLARMTYATTREAKIIFAVQKTRMYVNYSVNDAFWYNFPGDKPYGWNVSGNVTVATMESSYDTNSVKMDGTSCASKKFEEIKDKFVFEAYVLVTEKSDAVLSFKNADKTALKLDIKDGKILLDGKTVKDFDGRIWQLIRIECDTQTGKAVIKVNNKACLTAELSEIAVDGIEFVNNTNLLYFDDVELYNTYDYPDYVPAPASVTDDRWLVGMSVCSLWREGTHYGWDCVSPYDEITPVLGYYDEGLPEVADWEIKFLTEHGYDFPHYCWFMGGGNAPIKETPLSDAVVDGYMNAKYSDMMSMMIMWENANCTKTNSSFFYNYVWPYWCEWFFSDSRYLRIDNKAPVTIYKYDVFIQNMGGMEKAKEAVAFMREDIKRFGYDDIILFGCATANGFSKAQQQECKELGIEALVSYTFGEQSYEAQYQKDAMMKSHSYGEIPLMPSIGVGFNDIGWTETRTPLATVEAHKDVMEWAKNTYMPIVAKSAKEDWMSKFVFHTTWNEYGEGHYIMPSNLNKFGYVDANRAVFSSVAGKDDKAHFDIEPTDNQKARLGYLYPARTVPMRRELFVKDENAVENNEVVKCWDFEAPETVFMWKNLKDATAPQYDAKEKAVMGTTTAIDGFIGTVVSDKNIVDADKAKYLHVKIKHDAGNTFSMELYFKTMSNDSWVYEKGFVFRDNKSNGEYIDYYFDLTKNTNWKGNIFEIRFDPMNYVGTYYIKTIEFLSENSKDAFFVEVDGVENVISKGFSKKTDDGIFVAGNPSDGFYSLLNIYYEYNRTNGVLELFGNNDSELRFEVGSDTYLFYGKEHKLSQPVSRIDGLVLIPLKVICEAFGYEYKEEDGRAFIKVRKEVSVPSDIVLENQFEFNNPGNLEGFSITSATGAVTDGVLKITSSPVSHTKTGYDPIVINDKLVINSMIYNNIEVRFRPNFTSTSDIEFQDRFSIYFTTKKEPKLDEAKTFKIELKDMTLDSEGFYILKVDCKNNPKWTDIVTTLRFDPANLGGTYEFDYIRVSPDEMNSSLLAEETQRKKEAEKLLMAVDEGAAFYIENADAENIISNANITTASTFVTIVEDDLRPGNHAYKLVPDTKVKTWTYFRAKTRFKAGQTYKVEFDVRILCYQFENPGEKVSFVVNPRYSDVIDGTAKNPADHPVNESRFYQSASDGWQRKSVIFTISDNINVRDSDEFSIFVEPKTVGGQFHNFSVMFDNIVVSVTEPPQK